MDAFEEIVKLLLETKGYWVRQGVEVDISKDDKKTLNNATMPRPEIDLVAFSPGRGELMLVEVKSYLDSYGVYSDAVCTGKDKLSDRYKLFTDKEFRDLVSNRLREQLLKDGLILPSTTVRYALAAGHIHSKSDEATIRAHFGDKARDWVLYTAEDMRATLRDLSDAGWADNPVIQTAKLLLRETA